MYLVRRWIPSTGAGTNKRSKKQSETGCGPQFSAWKKNEWLFDGLKANSRNQAAER